MAALLSSFLSLLLCAAPSDLRSAPVPPASPSIAVLVAARAQPAQAKRDALTPAEEEEIREETDTPIRRLRVYMRILTEHAAAIAELNKSNLVERRGLKLHDAIDHFTAIVDELQNNLDEYQGYETNDRFPVPDLRKELPQMQKSITAWQGVLAALPANSDYDFVLETANESVSSLNDQSVEMIAGQNKYFAEKKLKDKLKGDQKEGNGVVLP